LAIGRRCAVEIETSGISLKPIFDHVRGARIPSTPHAAASQIGQKVSKIRTVPPAKFMVALATGNKMRSRPGSTPNGLLVSVPAYSRFPDGLVSVPAREQIAYCLILTREREP
jgi:hypothetical protein